MQLLACCYAAVRVFWVVARVLPQSCGFLSVAMHMRFSKQLLAHYYVVARVFCVVARSDFYIIWSLDSGRSFSVSSVLSSIKEQS